MKKKLNVTVFDMQPIDPPVGGGRIRLLGLYHRLGMPTTYIGSYDWPGERYRDQYLSETLREILIPLSDSHFSEHDKLKANFNGKNIIDCTFHQFVHLSTAFVDVCVKNVESADVVIFSHPWVYPLLRDKIKKPSQLVVYDSQNVEGYLRTQLLDDGGYGTEVAKEVIKIEKLICDECDLLLSCSYEDQVLFNQLYGTPFSKMRLAPNGVFTEKIKPATTTERDEAKRKLSLQDQKVALFIGSFYDPNVAAARFICFELAVKLPEMTFVICGGVCDAISKTDIANRGIFNVRIAGFLTEEEKKLYLKAADIAVNPMDAGSGTNIKMFDFFAAGLPVLTTPTGARGINPDRDHVFVESNLLDFPLTLQKIAGDSSLLVQLGDNGRKFVEEKFSWERISPALGKLFEVMYGRKTDRPYFSVIIATYERHELLSSLMKLLALQSFSDFEVIIVDQSKVIWEQWDTDFGFDVFYLHTDIKGAVKARNTGAKYATGRVLAFTDDDCEPEFDWLENAHRRFVENEIIGIEGLVKSDRAQDPNYRTVTNENFEGLGYMTANLFITVEVFLRINGFDERFDLPHFREDTDLGWRALKFGKIPYAKDVVVFHPPHKRDIKRESQDERNKFFTKDALLLKKHPQKYKELFFRERHYLDSGFRKFFIQGADDLNIQIPDWCYECFEQENFKEIACADAHIKLLNELMGVYSAEDVLPGEPLFEGVLRQKAEDALANVEQIIGVVKDADYYKCSRHRFLHSIMQVLKNVQPGGKILDVGNAPGYLAIALDDLGYEIHGINLNEHWNKTYPSQDLIGKFNVKSVDIEKIPLPYSDDAFDSIIFTEVLEYIAVTHPEKILTEFKRILNYDGVLIFSSSNVCNISNIIALLTGKNIFWSPGIFYGATDRHNREYTPGEVRSLFDEVGFREIAFYGINDSANWRSGTEELLYKLLEETSREHFLLRNTIISVCGLNR